MKKPYWIANEDEPKMRACNCIGPQNGQPLCPCMMRGVEIKDGRYVRTVDLGPVKDAPNPDFYKDFKL